MSDHLRGRVVRHSRVQLARRWWTTSPTGTIVASGVTRDAPRIVWEWQVVNTVTRQVVHRDNSACSLSEACDNARENLARCVDMWRMGIRSRDLKSGKADRYLIERDGA